MILSRLFVLFVIAIAFATGIQSALASPLSALAGRPNLAPRDINLGNYSARPGDAISMAWTTANLGTGSCPPSFTGIYIGASPTMRPGNEGLIFTYVTPGIAANSSVRQTNLITIPFNLPFGTYYLWVVSDDDPNSTLNQTTRADDVARSAPITVLAVPRQPNLVPQNITLDVTAARPGDPIAIMWTVTNIANVTAPASLTGFHLGTSATQPSTNDPLNLRFETPEIAANAGLRFTNFVVIPTNVVLGTYYVWVVVDDVSSSTLNQSSRADDAGRSAALSVVSVVTHPNLVPFDVSISKDQVLRGGQLNIAWSVTNSGNANCPASTTGLHLGASPTSPPANDILNIKVSTPAIKTNAFIRQTNSITIPAATPLGNYYIWVVVDDVPNSTLDQSTRADDAARSSLLGIVSVIRQPNLVASNVVLNAQFARPGDEITVTWALLNTGNTNAAPTQTGLRFGTSPTIPPTNTFLTISTPEIRTNTVFRQTNEITIPANLPLGTNYLWVIADDVTNSTLNQSSKADDAAVSGPLTIVSVLPRPNLAPLNVTLSTNAARPGSVIALAWTLTNSGNAACPASVTGVHLGQSPSTRPPTEPVLVVQTPAINAGGSVRQTNLLTIPANITAGTYYFWVVADDVAESTLNQSSRADDARPSGPIAITTVTLLSPALSATVDAPPVFEWNAPGLANATVYVTTKSNAVLMLDKVAFLENPSRTNKFQPAATNWTAAVNTLGFAANYYWTIGSSDPARREIYAEWRPFKANAAPVTGTPKITANGQFQFQIAAPNTSPVIIEASENLVNWTEAATLPNSTGIVTFTDSNLVGKAKRFFRVKR